MCGHALEFVHFGKISIIFWKSLFTCLFMHEFKNSPNHCFIWLLLCCFYVQCFNDVLCLLWFYDKMFVRKRDCNVYDYFMKYKLQPRTTSWRQFCSLKVSSFDTVALLIRPLCSVHTWARAQSNLPPHINRQVRFFTTLNVACIKLQNISLSS